MKVILRYYELEPMKLLDERQASSWGELHDIIARSGWLEPYEGGNVTEYEYETHIRNLDTRSFKHDVQGETSSIVLKTLTEAMVVHLNFFE